MWFLALALVGGWMLLSASSKASPRGGAGGALNEGKFELVETGQSGGDVYYNVFAKANAFGPHQRLFVLEYRETPAGQRVNMREQGDVPEEIRAAARTQFGLLPSAGVS